MLQCRHIYNNRVEMQQAIGVCQRRYHKFLDGFLSIPMMCPTSGSYPYGERLFHIPGRRFEGGPKLLNICYKDNHDNSHFITHYDIKNLYYDTADFTMRIYPDANDTFMIPVVFRVELNGRQKIGGSLAYSDLNIHNDEGVVNFSRQFSIYHRRSHFISHVIDTLLERSREKLLNAIAREIQEECTPYDQAADSIANIRNMLEYDSVRLEIDRNDNTRRVEKYIVTFVFNHRQGFRPFEKVREMDAFSMIYNGRPVTLYYTYCSRHRSYNKCYKTYPGFVIPDEVIPLNEYNMFNQRPLYINGEVPYYPGGVNVPSLGIVIPSEMGMNNFVNYGSYTAPTGPASSFNTVNELEVANMPMMEYMNNVGNYSRGNNDVPSVLANIPHIPVRVIYNNNTVNEINTSRVSSTMRRRGKSPKRAINTNRGLSYNTRRRDVGGPVEQYIPSSGRRNNRNTIKKRIAKETNL
jgi:hypothetical protein